MIAYDPSDERTAFLVEGSNSSYVAAFANNTDTSFIRLYANSNAGYIMGTSNVGQQSSFMVGMIDENVATAIPDVCISNHNIGFGGLLTPQYTVDVVGDLNYTGNLYWNNNIVPLNTWQSSPNNSRNIYTSANVGIGTSIPLRPLHVYQGNSNISQLFGEGAVINGSVAIMHGVNDSYRFISALDNTMTSGDTRFFSFGKTIGMHQQGELSYTNMGDNNPNSYVGIGLYGGTYCAVTGSGRMGVGTIAPQAKLQCVGGTVLGSGFSNIAAPNENTLLVSGAIGIGTANPQASIHTTGDAIMNTIILNNVCANSSSINFLSSAVTNISTLSTIGNVLVGGIMTACNVSVLGTTSNAITYNTNQLIVSNGGTKPALTVTQSGSGSSSSVADFVDNENGMAMRILSSGLIGIGTTNVTSRVGVNGNMAIGSAYSGLTAPSDGVIIAGNVGIGSSEPTQALDVNGQLVVRNIFHQEMNTTQFLYGIHSANFITVGDKYAGFNLGWSTPTTDKKHSFKVNAKAHFTSDTNATFSAIEGIINPVDDTTTSPNELIMGTATTTFMNPDDFTSITLTAVRASATSVNVIINYHANLAPSAVSVYLEILAPSALGNFTITTLNSSS